MTAAVVTRMSGMGRWEPNARGRLEQAAMELYREQGFNRTTVAEIAERAGLTERTFFRHYADKREVLFGGADEMKDSLVAAVAGAAESVDPLNAAAAGFLAVGAALEERRGREFARQRQRLIAANAELRERELSKLASWAAAVADILRARDVEESAARLAAEAALAVFSTAFERWTEEPVDRNLPDLIQESLDQLTTLATAGSARPPTYLPEK
jgi:AcrR family transcriptional regulator